jgi:hypothetical protein
MGADIASDLPAGAETAEKWEGQMVKIENATVVSYDTANYIYTLSQEDAKASEFLLGDNVVYQLEGLTLDIGTTYDINGVVDFSFDQYRINPRFQDDIVESTGFADNMESAQLHIYPNPVQSTLSIQNVSDFTQITVMDATGKVCATTFTGNANNVSIDVNHLRTGVYFVNFISEGKIKETKKIMVR